MRIGINHILVALTAAAFLVGCGSSSSDVASADTGTGYYLDSVVEGVDYTCGTQSGVTDAEGKFIFEQGKDCSFELGGIKLRKIKADELFDDIKVVETNASVAALLQTVDADGDPSNGITIKNEFKETIKEMVEAGTLDIEAPIDDTVLTEINTVLETTYPDLYNGVVVTEDDAMEHVNDTLESVIKELLAGKTVYTRIEDENNTIESLSFSSDFNSSTWTELVGGSCTGSGSLRIDGTDIVFTSETDSCDPADVNNSTIIHVLDIKDDYIKVEFIDELGNSFEDRLYFDKEKAWSYFLGLDATLEELLAGKTFYVVSLDNSDDSKIDSNSSRGSINLSTVSFNDDLTKLIDIYSDGSTSEENITIDGNKIIFTDDNSYSIVSQKDGYLYVEDFNADGSKDYESPIGHRLYENESDAQAYVDELSDGDYLRDLIVGKTFYEINSDFEVLNTVTFDDNGTVTVVDDNNRTETLNYTILNDYVFLLDDSEYDVVIEVTDEYFKFDTGGGIVTLSFEEPRI